MESLPEEVRVYDFTDVTGEDGVRRINVDANVDGVGQAMLVLNVADIPQEMLHWLQLYTDLLGEMDTSAHTRTELSSLIARYLYDAVIKVSMPYDEKYEMHVRSAWKASDEDMQAAYDLIWELLFDSQFTDGQRIAEAVSNLKNSKKQSINSGIYQSQLYRAMRISDPTQNVYQYMTDIDYYLFLEALEAAMAQDAAVATAPLQMVQAMVNNATGAISAFAGSKESQANNQAIADAFIAKLDKRDVAPAVYDIPAPARAEGIIAETNVQFNLAYATFEELGLEGYEGEMDAVVSLMNDKFFLPLLRDQYGVYSVMHGSVVDGGMYLLTYRDPNIQETYDVLAQVPAMMADFTIDQATLDGYILSAYSYYAQPAGELAGAESTILNVISGNAQDESLAYMQSLTGWKAAAVAKYADAYATLGPNGVRSTAGGAGVIEANAALFETILNPFNAVDTSKVEFTDCGEDHPNYEHVRFGFEQGYLAPVEATLFGVDQPANLGEYTAALYVLIGGSLVPDEAIAYLSQFGVVPAAEAATPLTREALIAYTVNFGAATGMEITPAQLPAFEDMTAVATRAEVAWVLYHFFYPIGLE